MQKKLLKHSEIIKPYLRGPLPLTPDNFTPVARTPWGGNYITAQIKKKICPELVGHVVGESWDFSCEPTFPSRILGSKVTLPELISVFPKELLSEEYIQSKGESCEILVKILNAAENLSLQVHPSNEDPSLKENECGKFESWFVIHAEADAGIYMGFKEGLSKQDFEQSLRNSEDLRPLLNFVPVKAGDYFEIPYGVCHAIGKGVVVLEPQHVLASKIGMTYRIYDWGCKYTDGRMDPNGKPREMHVEAALPLIDPELQCGASFLKKLRGELRTQKLSNGVLVESYGSNIFYKFHRVHVPKNQIFSIVQEGAYAAMIPIEGSFALRAPEGNDTYWQMGQPGFLPAACFPLRFEALEDTVVFFISPENAKESWHAIDA